MQPDYYQILHVHPDADPEVIKASYRTLMQKLKNHPDLGGDQAKAKLINEAYSVLSDAKRRAQYDAGTLSFTDASQKTAESPSDQEKLLCPFCKRPNFLSQQPQAEDLHCTACKSPLRFIDFDPEWVGHRAVRSAKQNMSIRFIESSQSSKTGAGTVEDLSPTGLRFASQSQLRMGNIIKLESSELSAVASVMRCQPGTVSNQYITAVKFLSLKLHKTRGAFVSYKA